MASVAIRDEIYHESEEIDITFPNNDVRTVHVFDLLMARRAIQDAIIARMTPDADEDALASMVYTPMFEERLVIKFDPDGLAFFLYPMKKDGLSAYADTRYPVPFEYIDDDEDGYYGEETEI